MNCHESQTALAADPGTHDPQVLAHLESCAQCASYRRDMQEMDRLIQRALAVPVDASITSVRTAAPARTKRMFHRGWQIAASLLLSVTIGASIWVASTRDSLAEQMVQHTQHESFAYVRTDEHADPATVEQVLGSSGVKLRAGALHVSYAAHCPFRGGRVPHLVVQTDEGPVTVFVMPNETSTKSTKRFNEEGYEGVIVPAPRGVLAVLGKNVPVEDVVHEVLAAIEY